MTALWLTNDDVAQLVDVSAGVDQMERAYRALGEGRNFERNPYKISSSKPLEPPWTCFYYRTIEGGAGNYWGVRIFPQVAAWPETNGVRKRTPVPASGGKLMGFVLVFDVRTARLVAGMHDSYINWLAVGATTGLGTKYQARHDAKVAGMIGSGRFGRSVFRATFAAHPFEEAKVYSPTYEHAKAFASEMKNDLGISVTRTRVPEETMRESDIIMCSTNSPKPVIDGRLLKRGTSVSSIFDETPMLEAPGSNEPLYVQERRELDDETIRRAGTIMVCSKAGAEYERHTELYDALKVRHLSDWDSMVELGDVVAGKSRGRKNDEELTVFKQNVNGIWYAALGSFAYEEARKRGLGQEVDDDLFMAKPKR